MRASRRLRRADGDLSERDGFSVILRAVCWCFFFSKRECRCLLWGFSLVSLEKVGVVVRGSLGEAAVTLSGFAVYLKDSILLYQN